VRSTDPFPINEATTKTYKEKFLLYCWTKEAFQSMNNFLLTSLRHNSHSMKFIHCKCIVQEVLVVIIQLCNHHCDLVLEHFPYPRKFPPLGHSKSNLAPILRPKEPLICFDSLEVSQEWNHHCVWLLSLSKTFSRFIHVLSCISALLRFIA
jgi:hypothetical protein